MTLSLVLFAIALGGVSILCWIFEFENISILIGLSDVVITMFLSLFIFSGSSMQMCIGLGMSNFYSAYQILKHVKRYGWGKKY